MELIDVLLNLTQRQQILTATRAQSGNAVPIVIRSDADTRYSEVDRVMQAVGGAAGNGSGLFGDLKAENALLQKGAQLLKLACRGNTHHKKITVA